MTSSLEADALSAQTYSWSLSFPSSVIPPLMVSVVHFVMKMMRMRMMLMRIMMRIMMMIRMMMRIRMMMMRRRRR